jgi:hypothetical protein
MLERRSVCRLGRFQGHRRPFRSRCRRLVRSRSRGPVGGGFSGIGWGMEGKVCLTYEDDDLGSRPDSMDSVDEVDITLGKFLACDVVLFVVIVCSEIDDYEIGWGLGGEVPTLGLVTIDLVGALRGIGCLIPLVFLEGSRLNMGVFPMSTSFGEVPGHGHCPSILCLLRIFQGRPLKVMSVTNFSGMVSRGTNCDRELDIA